MTVAASRPSIAALKGLLTGAGLTVLDGGDGTPTAPCVVLWPSPGLAAAGSLGDPVSDLNVEVTTVAVGASADQAMWVSDKITTTLTWATPTVSGRTVHPIRCIDTAPLVRDDDLTAGLWSAATRWRLTTTP